MGFKTTMWCHIPMNIRLLLFFSPVTAATAAGGPAGRPEAVCAVGCRHPELCGATDHGQKLPLRLCNQLTRSRCFELRGVIARDIVAQDADEPAAAITGAVQSTLLHVCGPQGQNREFGTRQTTDAISWAALRTGTLAALPAQSRAADRAGLGRAGRISSHWGFLQTDITLMKLQVEGKPSTAAPACLVGQPAIGTHRVPVWIPKGPLSKSDPVRLDCSGACRCCAKGECDHTWAAYGTLPPLGLRAVRRGLGVAGVCSAKRTHAREFQVCACAAEMTCVQACYTGDIAS
jgi:hypothetical protein